MDRADTLHFLTATSLDVLVVGGGIVGSGILRDAAMRGLRVGLLEQYDLVAGTSGRSSRLLHGGLRYLAQGRVGLVREASREKLILSRIAPGLAEPLAFVFPSYAGAGWPLWKLRIGVGIYDLLCGRQNLGRSSVMGAAATCAHVPGLLSTGLKGAVRYYDGLTSDARLVLDTLRSAVVYGAGVATRCRLVSAVREDGLWRCEVEDRRSGETLEVRARCVVSAAGPWGGKMPNHSLPLRLTKGVHLVVPRERLPVPDAVVMPEGTRILFCIPWGERTVIGTTDTDYSGRVEDVCTEAEDVRYILKVVNRYFPDANLCAEDVVAEWAGLRPLIAEHGAGTESEMSRRHQMVSPTRGWLEIGGGKLTTYRQMAEEAVDVLVREQGFSATPCRTANTPLLMMEGTPGERSVIPPDPSRERVLHYCREEWAMEVEDIMVRRTRWHYYRDDCEALADDVATWMQEALGWSDEERELARARYQGPQSVPGVDDG